MPMMDLTLPADVLDGDAKTALADDLTTALLRAERAPDTDFFRSITWVFMHELPEGAVYRAGRPIERPLVRLAVTTPEGALSDRRRAELVADATRVLQQALGIADEDARMHIWVVCREIAEGSWGAGGDIVHFQELVDAAAAARSEAQPA
jgi:phenylpyruvate tautomerase PptA (4-oxalocrotonate tautomerase family)